MLTTSNKYIRTIFGKYFVILRTLREVNNLTNNLLLLWTRRVPLLVKLVVFFHCKNYKLFNVLLIIEKKKCLRKTLLDTPDHKAKRKMLVNEWYTVLPDNFANIAMFGEKLFYTTDKRRKTKKLLLGKRGKR